MKNKSDIKIIFVDIDWTLYDHKQKCFVKSGLRALKKAQKNGVKIILCTSRPYSSIKGLGAFDVVPYDGYVCANGGIAFVDEKYILKHVINPEALKRVIDIVRANDFVMEIINPKDAYLLEKENEVSKRFYENWAEVKPRVDFFKGEEVTSCLLFSHRKDDILFKDVPLYFSRFFDEGCDIYEIKYSKDMGVKAILDYFKYSPDQAMAIGDADPDIDMFKLVTYSIAMGNGSDECKKSAFYVTDHISKNGLKNALKHFRVI